MKVDARTESDIGVLRLRDFDVATDARHAHAWLTHPHAHFWGMGANTPADTRAYFQAIANSDTHRAWLGSHDEVPMFLAECYAPSADVIGDFYDVEDGDIGMHVLIAPPTRRISGFTWAVFSLVVDTVFAETQAQRIVVEPDIQNTGIHRLNARAGFTAQRQINLGDKIALFSTLTRERHAELTRSGARL